MSGATGTNGTGPAANGTDSGSASASASPSPSGEIVLETRGASKTYHAPGGGLVRALVDVDVSVVRGRTLGLIGESGSGKTTLTRLLLSLEPATAGEVIFEGRNLASMGAEEQRRYRRSVAAVFQNPYSSLDPRMRIWDAVTEQTAIERSADRKARKARAASLLDLVGLDPTMVDRYPHQLSGGQRQRVAIARAMALDPEVIVLDEPLSALDVSVSAQIVNLLLDLQERVGVTYVFVGHDLRLVRHLCHDVAVLYRGRVVEQGPSLTVLDSPSHPYTDALVTASSLATLAATDDADTKALAPDDGIGCPYRTRCPGADARCEAEAPEVTVLDDGRRLRCHHPVSVSLGTASREPAAG